MVSHVQDVAVVGNVLVPDSVSRIVLEKVSQAIERHQVVRRHDLDVAAVHSGFGEQHTDPAETIYSYSYGHFSLLSLACLRLVFCPKSRKIMQHTAFGSQSAFQHAACGGFQSSTKSSRSVAAGVKPYRHGQWSLVCGRARPQRRGSAWVGRALLPLQPLRTMKARYPRSEVSV